MKKLIHIGLLLLAVNLTMMQSTVEAQTLEMSGVTDLTYLAGIWGFGFEVREQGSLYVNAVVGAYRLQRENEQLGDRGTLALGLGLEYEHRLESFAQERLVPYLRLGIMYGHRTDSVAVAEWRDLSADGEWGELQLVEETRTGHHIRGSFRAGLAYYPGASFGVLFSAGLRATWSRVDSNLHGRFVVARVSPDFRLGIAWRL
jgi:hypothetical protein